MQQAASSSGTNAVVEILSRRPRRARFVAEIAEAARRAGISGPKVEQALAALEAEGAALVLAHSCADPHLEGADLRIAALVDEADDGGDAQATAVAAIGAAWQRWIGDYLANHRCT